MHILYYVCMHIQAKASARKLKHRLDPKEKRRLQKLKKTIRNPQKRNKKSFKKVAKKSKKAKKRWARSSSFM